MPKSRTSFPITSHTPITRSTPPSTVRNTIHFIEYPLPNKKASSMRTAVLFVPESGHTCTKDARVQLPVHHLNAAHQYQECTFSQFPWRHYGFKDLGTTSWASSTSVPPPGNVLGSIRAFGDGAHRLSVSIIHHVPLMYHRPQALMVPRL